jgi:hypothetical protein
MLRLFLWFILLLYSNTNNAVDHKEDIDLDLLEVVLSPLSQGGSCNNVAKTTKAIIRGTRGAHQSIQEIARMRGDRTFERSLHRWTRRQPWYDFLPEPFEFKVLKNTRHGDQLLSHYAILPHELFSCLYHKSLDLFELLFTGGEANLEDWWRQAALEGGDWLRLHPVIASQPCSSLRVPFGVHGDDAGVQGCFR